MVSRRLPSSNSELVSVKTMFNEHCNTNRSCYFTGVTETSHFLLGCSTPLQKAVRTKAIMPFNMAFSSFNFWVLIFAHLTAGRPDEEELMC